VVDLIRDPREERNVAEPSNAWLQFKAIPLMLQFLGSTKTFPNVPVGAGNDYQPATKP
jgi:hypothetical protein